MGLRLTRGIDLDRYERLSGAPLSQTVLKDLSDMGMIETEGGWLRVTPSGRIVLNAVIAKLLE